jgi:hypothetical protein
LENFILHLSKFCLICHKKKETGRISCGILGSALSSVHHVLK